MRHLHGIPINLTGRDSGLRTKFAGAAASKFCTDEIKQLGFTWENLGKKRKKKTQKTFSPFLLPEPNCTNRTCVQKNPCNIKQSRLTQKSQLALALSQSLQATLRCSHAHWERQLRGLVFWVVVTTSGDRRIQEQMDGCFSGCINVHFSLCRAELKGSHRQRQVCVICILPSQRLVHI